MNIDWAACTEWGNLRKRMINFKTFLAHLLIINLGFSRGDHLGCLLEPVSLYVPFSVFMLRSAVVGRPALFLFNS